MMMLSSSNDPNPNPKSILGMCRAKLDVSRTACLEQSVGHIGAASPAWVYKWSECTITNIKVSVAIHIAPGLYHCIEVAGESH